MADLALLPLSADVADGIGLDLLDGDLVLDDSLRSAVVISLFTDSENPDGTDPDRRGWWGDALGVQGDRIGSLLWKLQREKETPSVLVDAKRYAEAALAWMLADGVARAVTATATFPERGRLDIEIAIDRPSGRELIRFADIWAASLKPFQGRIATDRVSDLQRLAAAWVYIVQFQYPQVIDQ
ncbi:phage GP46 family protein [Nevskia ramosa]|uniref:phage GP46 family protein n=1 Tax=Nevskia ramosa TaxID=64002 RepID=UPI00235460E7|nr:phage GP46 family protein [Nevskia ramosa]